MSGIQVSPEAVEAVLQFVTPDGFGEGTDRMRRESATRALEAAAPILYREWSEKLLGEEAVEAASAWLYGRIMLERDREELTAANFPQDLFPEFVQAWLDQGQEILDAALPDQEEGS